MLKAWSKSRALYSVITGDSFSPEKGVEGPVPVSSTIRHLALISSARDSPAMPQIFSTLCAVTAEESLPPGNMLCCSVAFSETVSSAPPTRVSAAMGLLTQPISFAGCPVVAAPMWPSLNEGLPLGIQIITAPWREDLAFRVAKQLESLGVCYTKKLA